MVAVEIILASLLLIVAVVWFAKRSKSGKNSLAQSEQTSLPERLALSSLLDATMTGMREGLLVVNRDMRVVASNPAARKLFNPSVATLQSQRLTELTRNPAIYSAFLDGLKGIERSGVKVETHGPERQIFDLLRNPAIYSAFLDGLKGIERSGVKVETHGPERQIFDLPRNPAIYSAFLDGLKGIERSGVKVETHGPERQIFDLPRNPAIYSAFLDG